MTLVALSWPHLQAGDWATWVGSVGIVSTLGVAVYQLGRDQRFRRREVVRTRAEKVAAWYGGEVDNPNSGTVLAMINGSAEPIYDVVCTLVFVQGAAPSTGEEWVKLATDGMRQLPYGCVFAAVGPGRWKAVVDGGWRAPARAQAPKLVSPTPAVVTGSAGRTAG